MDILKPIVQSAIGPDKITAKIDMTRFSAEHQHTKKKVEQSFHRSHIPVIT